jgi:ParB-like chromosome segregation protein Spo0J
LSETPAQPVATAGRSRPKAIRSLRRSPKTTPPPAAGSEAGRSLYDGAAVLHLELRQLRTDYAGIRASDPVAEAKLLASIAREGQKVPILVAREGDAHQVLDGFRRRQALEQLGRDIVFAVEWPTGTVDGLVEVRRLRTASASGPLEEGWLIEMLVDRHELSLQEIGERLGRTRSWVHRRLSLVRQLPEAVRLKVLSGALSGYIATKYAVPLARANAELVAPYCDSVIAHGLSTRQAGVVYQYLTRTTDPSIQKEILARPQRVLEPGDRAGNRAGATTEGLKSIDRLEGWCRHTSAVHGTVTRLLRHGTSDDVIERIAVLWGNHREMARAIYKQLDDLAVLAPGAKVLARANTLPAERTEAS